MHNANLARVRQQISTLHDSMRKRYRAGRSPFAGRPEQRDELAAADAERDVLDRGHSTSQESRARSPPAHAFNSANVRSARRLGYQREGFGGARGREVRVFRKKLGITVADLASTTNISLGMLSKIENGETSPSLTTLQTCPMPLGRGTRAGHQYAMLAHMSSTPAASGRALIDIQSVFAAMGRAMSPSP